MEAAPRRTCQGLARVRRVGNVQQGDDGQAVLGRGPLAGGREGRLRLLGELGQRVLQAPPLPAAGGRAEGQQGHRFLHRRAVVLGEGKGPRLAVKAPP